MINLAGQRIGRLTIMERAGTKRGPGNCHATWRALCDCGTEVVRQSTVLRRGGDTSSCGCLQRELAARRLTTHGSTYTRTYITWCAMIRRCENEGADNFKHYGGRGITVCDRWHDFSAFLADMGERPAGKSLDRIDNAGNYEPSNCRWSTQEEQCSNRRNSVRYEANGKSLTIREWSRLTGLAPSLLWTRINELSWPVERAVSQPSRRRRT